MQLNALIERLHLLQSQARWPESKTLLETYLADHPDEPIAQLYYVNTLSNMGEKERARELVGPLLSEHPDNPMVLRLAAIIELNDGKPKIAEQFAGQLMEMDAEDDDAYTLMAKAKLDQRNYDAALHYVDEALAVNPQNTEALNMKIYIGGFLGKTDTDDTISEALHINPEDSSTIANHGYQLLRNGKVDEALERLKYALSLNPTDQLARFAMLEALKARFWPYRMYFKYQEAMSKLSGGASFGIMIGLWFGVNFLNRQAVSNPEYAPYIMPLVYIMVFLFLLTWIIDPLMNFYLLTNKYGRLLLDKDDKLMASLVGGSLGLALLSGIAWLATGFSTFQLFAAAFVMLTIPLGSFLRPKRKQPRLLLTIYTAALVGFALIGIPAGSSLLINLALFGLLAYQFIINGMMAREHGRTFGE
ncbi:tetratricopeptide repeat protein [Neolewinella aurantiaca]|uniref:Tetratricopeptide repeat protein n=1 Tax=Neolewinella aurantiaca TaxID=2602767 RepID=A0A5C7FU61_9BACT|nr:tetratricopeptide repeat protein [Neolewinella aurantiaca]TXF89822.1 tetratricopeptide repeat protein [Neolewinella aurantiaca]